MKRIIALLAMLLLVAAVVPMALADNDTGNATGTARLGLVKEKIQLAVERYQDALGKYKNAIDKYESAKKDFLAAEGKANNFGSANLTPELMNKTKDFLYNSIDKGVSNLETVKAWIEKVNISQDQKDTLTLELDQHIANLNSLKRDVDDIVIKIQAVDAARKIRSEWQYAKKTIKKSVGLAISARTALVTNQLSTLSNRLQSRVDALKADNKDISKIQPLIDKFDEKLSLATQDYNAANAKFQAISDSQDENKVMQQGMELLRSAHQDLKDAQGILVQIVKEFRALNTPIDTELNRTSTAIGEDS